MFLCLICSDPSQRSAYTHQQFGLQCYSNVSKCHLRRRRILCIDSLHCWPKYVKFVEVHNFPKKSIDVNHIYFLQFIIIGTICTTGRTEALLNSEGTGTGIWIQNGTSADDTVQIPQNRPESENEDEANGWTKNNCLPSMGKKGKKLQIQIISKIYNLLQQTWIFIALLVGH